MTNHAGKQHPIEKLVEDVEFKQRNTTWPDAMVNASGVDELLFKGSRRITKIQRVGVAFLGLAFVLGGISILGSIDSTREGWWIGIPIATGIILVGCKLLWNGVRKNDPPREDIEDE
ncbi:MAG: hypothetical protein ACRD3K_02755 [Edaphobacter sp.]